MKKLYNWVLELAHKPHSLFALFILAFMESSFFPIPPDVLLIALGMGAPKKAFRFALICSIGSVLGGILGYYIGFAFWEAVGPYFTDHVFSEESFLLVQDKYSLYSFWVVFTAAFTPIPYKVFTITAGVFHINFVGFVIASLVGRSLRFFLVATALYFYGEKAKAFVDKYFGWFAYGLTALLILGYFLIKQLH